MHDVPRLSLSTEELSNNDHQKILRFQFCLSMTKCHTNQFWCARLLTSDMHSMHQKESVDVSFVAFKICSSATVPHCKNHPLTWQTLCRTQHWFHREERNKRISQPRGLINQVVHRERGSFKQLIHIQRSMGDTIGIMSTTAKAHPWWKAQVAQSNKTDNRFIIGNEHQLINRDWQSLCKAFAQALIDNKMIRMEEIHLLQEEMPSQSATTAHFSGTSTAFGTSQGNMNQSIDQCSHVRPFQKGIKTIVIV